MFIQGVEYRVVVEVPQLTALTEQLAFLNEQINQYGERLMANFADLSTNMDALRADLVAKLDELAALMQADLTDQANIDALNTNVTEMRALLQPPPAPTP